MNHNIAPITSINQALNTDSSILEYFKRRNMDASIDSNKSFTNLAWSKHVSNNPASHTVSDHLPSSSFSQVQREHRSSQHFLCPPPAQLLFNSSTRSVLTFNNKNNMEKHNGFVTIPISSLGPHDTRTFPAQGFVMPGWPLVGEHTDLNYLNLPQLYHTGYEPYDIRALASNYPPLISTRTPYLGRERRRCRHVCKHLRKHHNLNNYIRSCAYARSLGYPLNHPEHFMVGPDFHTGIMDSHPKGTRACSTCIDHINHDRMAQPPPQ